MAIYRVPLARYSLWLLMVFLVFIFPFITGNYILSIANLIGIAVVGAQGLNILVGYAGQVSLGQGAFMAVGAYTAGVLFDRFGLSFWIGIPAAGFMTAIIGSFFGIPSLRVKGLYLAIATLAAQFIIEWVLLHGSWITGKGAQSALIISDPGIGGFVFGSELRKFYFILFFAVLATVIAQNLARTRIGRAFVAIRDQDIAAEIMGVDIFRYKLLAFAISSFFVGVAGALWAYYTNVVSYEHFTIETSIQYLAMIIIGGLGSIQGPILGAVLLTLLPTVLREVLDLFKDWGFPGIVGYIAYLRELLFGVVIVIFLIFEPEGLYKIWRRFKDYFRLWPFAY